MDERSRWGRLRAGVWLGLGLGLLAGGMECVGLAASLRLPLSVVDFAVLGAADALLMAGVAAIYGVGVGVPWVIASGELPEHRAIAGHLAWTTLLLCGTFLWQGAWVLYAHDDRAVPAAAMALMPVGFAGVVFYNAAFWLRKAAVGKAPRVGWMPAAALGAAVMVLGSSVVYPMRDTGGGFALEGDANVLLLTVDGLRFDAARALAAVEPGGIRFDNAVAPAPSARAAASTVLTGLHPLRHRVLDDSATLSRGFRSLAEVLEAEGYATGAFVSSTGVDADSGLEQGFAVYDDAFTPGVPALTRINLVGHAARGAVALLGPERVPFLAGRPAARTVDGFETWLDTHGDVPFLAWVHLADPAVAARSGDRAAYDAAVDTVGAQVRRALDLVEAAGAADRTIVVAVGSHGAMLGEHGARGAVTLFDPAVRVPLVVRAPGADVRVSSVGAQVRLMDLAATTLEWLELDPMDESEGVGLLGYGSGSRRATIWCALVGRDLAGDPLLGLRNNGVKYVRAADGSELMFDVVADPDEQDDLTERQEATLEQARRLLAADQVALDKLLSGRR